MTDSRESALSEPHHLDTIANPPAVEPKSRKRFEITGYLVALAIAAVVIWLLLWPAFQNVRDGFTAANWPTTEAKVSVSSKSKSGGGSNRPRTTYRFRYEYSVDNQQFTGWRYSLCFPSGSQRHGVKKHDVGDRVRIRYNPAHPHRSAVDVDSSNWWNYLVIGGSMFIGFFAYRRLYS